MDEVVEIRRDPCEGVKLAFASAAQGSLQGMYTMLLLSAFVLLPCHLIIMSFSAKASKIVRDTLILTTDLP